MSFGVFLVSVAVFLSAFLVVVPVALSGVQQSRARAPNRGAGSPHPLAALAMFTAVLPLSMWITAGSTGIVNLPYVTEAFAAATPVFAIVGFGLGLRIVRESPSVRRGTSIAKTFE